MIKYIIALVTCISVIACTTAFDLTPADDYHILSQVYDDTMIIPLNEVDQQPMFQGGEAGLYLWLSSNLRAPSPEENSVWRVAVQFIIDQDGSIKNIEVVRGKDSALAKELVRLVSIMPQWIPAQKNGSPVRVKYVLPMDVHPSY